METRAVVAAVLMAVLLIFYQMFFVPAPPPAKGPAPPAPSTAASRPASGPSPAVPGAAAVTPLPAAKSVVVPPARTVRVDTPLYSASVSSDGGRLVEWTLHYRGEKALVEAGQLGPRGLVLSRPGVGARPVAFALKGDSIRLDAKNNEGVVAMSGEDPYGVRVSQTATFRADEYTVDLSVRLQNTRPAPQTVGVSLPWVAPIQPGTSSVQWPTELVWSVDGWVQRDLVAKAPPREEVVGDWAGVDSVYYLAGLVPKSSGFKLAVGKQGPDRVEAALTQTVTLAPGQVWEARAQLYAGPKEYDRLRAHGLDGAINFGGFPVPRNYGGLPMAWLGIPVLVVMNFFYRFIGNYGVAIILLTVVTKTVFFPLTIKSMTSMRKMQTIQPQANAIRAKYKGDPQRAQRETLELYRREGVNPVGGCLPMLIQVPIFYALYIALQVSVELQNAPFICFGRLFGKELWICDLAAYDPTYVLPVVMGLTMFIQQKMQPTVGDPTQAKMMLLMPVVFTFMFFKLPAGLVLYWSVSNALQILQQHLMNRKPVRSAGRGAKDVARA